MEVFNKDRACSALFYLVSVYFNYIINLVSAYQYDFLFSEYTNVDIDIFVGLSILFSISWVHTNHNSHKFEGFLICIAIWWVHTNTIFDLVRLRNLFFYLVSAYQYAHWVTAEICLSGLRPI